MTKYGSATHAVGLEKLNVINFNIVLKHNHSRINEMDKKIIANNIRSIAIDIIAADDSYKSERQKIQDGIKIVAAAKKNFETTHDSIMSQIETLQKQKEEIDSTIKELSDKLKAEWKPFDKINGITAAGKAAAKTLVSLMSVGVSAESLLEGLDEAEKSMVRASESSQPSYSAAYHTLVSLLTGTEYEVYVKLIEESFHKQIVEFEKATYQSLISAKEFPAEFRKKYEERQKEWNKRNPDNPMEDLKAAAPRPFAELGLWIKSKFSSVALALKNAVLNLFGISEEAPNITKFFDSIASKCRSLPEA